MTIIVTTNAESGKGNLSSKIIKIDSLKQSTTKTKGQNSLLKEIRNALKNP